MCPESRSMSVVKRCRKRVFGRAFAGRRSKKKGQVLGHFQHHATPVVRRIGCEDCVWMLHRVKKTRSRVRPSLSRCRRSPF